QAAHLAKHLERPRSLRLIDLRDGESDVHDHVVADSDVVGNVRQTDLAPNSAEVDESHSKSAIVTQLHHSSGNSQAHGIAPLFLWMSDHPRHAADGVSAMRHDTWLAGRCAGWWRPGPCRC